TIRPFGGTDDYDLVFRYGRKVLSANQYFSDVFLREDPRGQLTALPSETADAIARGTLRPGMSKAETVQARGYPPRHRTSNLENDEWLYYDSQDTVSRVRFQDGKIADVTQDKAPGS